MIRSGCGLTFLLFSILSVSLVSAQTTVTLSPGADIQQNINTLAAGSTILLNPGTYTPGASLLVNKALTIKNASSSGPVYINVPNSQANAFYIPASNVTLSGFTISGPSFSGPPWGIYAGDGAAPPAQNSSIVLQNITYNAPSSSSSGGHGLFVRNVINAVVDNCTVNNALVNGIDIDAGSTGALVINNTVTNAHQDGIVVQDSDSAVVAGNTVTSAAVDAIILVGANFSRIERNTLNNPGVDGITITRDNSLLSTGNYIGKNTATAGHPFPGAGIWVNAESDGTLVYGNFISGFPENGIDLFNSSFNQLRGNVTSSDLQGGIFIYGPTNLSYSVGNTPNYNVVDNNYTSNLPFNAGVIVRQANNNTIFGNFFQGPSNSGLSFQTSSGNLAYLNTLANLQNGVYAFSDSSSSSYFLNRQLTPMLNYALQPAGISFDGGPILGGNFWAGHNNTTPYTNIIFDQQGDLGGPYADHYPYANDLLGKPASLVPLLPAAGSFAAVGSRKTMEWLSTGCSYTDISYNSSETGLVSIAANYPDVGHYDWVVPNIALASDYSIILTCKNAAQQALVSVGGPSFSIAKAGLELLSPQANNRVLSGSAVKVAWTKGPSTGNVNVLYRGAVGSFSQLLASNISGDYVTVTVPGGAATEAAFLVQEVASGGSADSTDGFVTVMDNNPKVFGPVDTLPVGTLQHVEWTSIPGSLYVDLELLNPVNGMYIPLIQNLPDFGSFNFLVPTSLGNGAAVRAFFKSSPSTVIAEAGAAVPDLSPFNGGFETGTVGPWASFGGVSAPVTTAVWYAGAYSLAESGGSGGVYEDVGGLTPGQFYRVTARARSTGGSATAALWVHDTTGSNGVIDGYRIPSSTSWDEFALNYQADLTGTLRIHLLFSGGSGSVFWDQVQVMPGWQSDFESGALAGWTPFGGASSSASSAASNSGLYSVLESGGNGGIYQDIGGLTAGGLYHILVRAHSAAGTSGQALLYVHDTLGNNTVVDGARTPSASGWDEFEVNFLATSSERVRIHLIFTGGSGGVYFDDVVLSQGWFGGFEQGTLAPWLSFGSTASTVTNALANGGAFSLIESGGSGGVYQDLAGLVPGQLFNVSARAHSAAGTSSGALLWLHDTTGGAAVTDGARVPSSADWDLFSANFAADNTGKMRIHLMDTGGSGTLYWDDVTVQQGLQEGFENGTVAPWLQAGSVTAVVSSALPDSGAYSLAESGGSGLVYRDFSGLQPGQYYRVTVRVRSAAGTGGQAMLYVHDTTGANTVVDGPRTPSSAGWDELALNFLATGTGVIRIHLVYTGGAGTVYWDQLQALRAWGSGFDNGTIAPWSTTGATTQGITASQAYSGTSSLQQSGSTGGAYIDVPNAIPGQLYRITARGRSAQGSAARGLLYVHDGTGAHAVTDGYRTPSTATWDEFGVNFTATGTGDIRVHLLSDGGSGTLFWDEVNIIPILQ